MWCNKYCVLFLISTILLIVCSPALLYIISDGNTYIRTNEVSLDIVMYMISFIITHIIYMVCCFFAILCCGILYPNYLVSKQTIHEITACILMAVILTSVIGLLYYVHGIPLIGYFFSIIIFSIYLIIFTKNITTTNGNVILKNTSIVLTIILFSCFAIKFFVIL